jgi:hypothetical protein
MRVRISVIESDNVTQCINTVMCDVPEYGGGYRVHIGVEEK